MKRTVFPTFSLIGFPVRGFTSAGFDFLHRKSAKTRQRKSYASALLFCVRVIVVKITRLVPVRPVSWIDPIRSYTIDAAMAESCHAHWLRGSTRQPTSWIKARGEIVQIRSILARQLLPIEELDEAVEAY